MKRTIVILSVLGLALVSCKKDQTPEALTTETTETITENEGKTQREIIEEEIKSRPQTTIALSENHWDFKDVKKGEKVEHIYEITNTGDNPLIISYVQPSCGCTAPDYTKEPILPGQKGQITLSFDSSNFEGFQSKRAEVFTNVENSPVELTFTANVIQ